MPLAIFPGALTFAISTRTKGICSRFWSHISRPDWNRTNSASGEFSDPLDEKEALEALEDALPGAKARLAAGDIEFVRQSPLEQPAHDWDVKRERALARGCAGMRVNVTSAWLAAKSGRNPDAYQDELSGIIANQRMIVLCAYPLEVTRAAEIFDAGYTHRFAIAGCHGDWRVVGRNPRVAAGQG